MFNENKPATKKKFPQRYGAAWGGPGNLQWFGRLELGGQQPVFWVRAHHCTAKPRTVATPSRRLRRKVPGNYQGSVRDFARQAMARGDTDAAEWLANKGTL